MTKADINASSEVSP